MCLSTFAHRLSDDLTPQDTQRLRGFPWFSFLTIRGVMSGLQQQNRIIREVAQSEDVIVVDNEKMIPKTWEYFVDSCHFTEKGRSLLARNLCEAIVGAGIVDS